MHTALAADTGHGCRGGEMCLSLAVMLYSIHEQSSFTGTSEIEEAPGWGKARRQGDFKQALDKLERLQRPSNLA